MNNMQFRNICPGSLENIGSLSCANLDTFFFLRHQNIMLVNLTTNPFKTLVLARLQVPRDNTRSSQILNAGSSFPCKCKTTLFILKEMPLTFAVESFHGIKMFHETVAAPLTCVSFQLLPGREGQALRTPCSSVGQSSV